MKCLIMINCWSSNYKYCGCNDIKYKTTSRIIGVRHHLSCLCLICPHPLPLLPSPHHHHHQFISLGTGQRGPAQLLRRLLPATAFSCSVDTHLCTSASATFVVIDIIIVEISKSATVIYGAHINSSFLEKML